MSISHLISTGCNGCGTHTDDYFDTANSSTSQLGFSHRCTNSKECKYGVASTSCLGNKCSLSQSYLEGSSWYGQLTVDFIYLGGPNDFDKSDKFPRTKAGFACDSKVTGMFTNQVSNGIMGFSRAPNSFVAQLIQDSLLSEHIFSMCFSRTGGDMVLGGSYISGRHAGEALYESSNMDMQYTPALASSSNWYRVQIEKLELCKGDTGKVMQENHVREFLSYDFLVFMTLQTTA